MQIDSASLYLFVKELQKLLIPAQVRQIHQIDNRIMTSSCSARMQSLST